MITPMVARLVRDPFDREGWLFELKWDGFRTIAETDGTNGVKLYSRNQKDFKKRFSPIADALAKLKKPAILDGELVALDEHGHPRFEWLLNRGPQKGTLVYYVFDLLKLGDVDLRGEPLRRRKKLLANGTFFPHAEECAMRQHDGHAARGRSHRLDHVLHPSIVACLGGWHPGKVTTKRIARPHFVTPRLTPCG